MTSFRRTQIKQKHKGRLISVDSITIDSTVLVVTGKLLRTARLKDEWYDDIADPGKVMEELRNSGRRVDILTFWQRLPDTEPQYPYYAEFEALSAIPIKTYRHWWDHQIGSDTRKKVKRPAKRGVDIRVTHLDDELIRGIMGIFNETPVRRGKPCWHYGKSFHEVKDELSKDLGCSDFIGAFYDDQLIGIVKLVYAPGRFANPGVILSKISFRHTYVNNALIAKCVELCHQHDIPYLTYTNWRRGSQADFLRRHGFERILVPRYYCGLTAAGRVAVKLTLHREMKTRVPEKVKVALLRARSEYYRWKYRNGYEIASALDRAREDEVIPAPCDNSSFPNASWRRDNSASEAPGGEQN